MRSWVVFDRKHPLFALLALGGLVVTLVSFAAKVSGRYHVTNKSLSAAVVVQTVGTI